MRPEDAPPVSVKFWGDREWREVPDDDDWVFMGICPAPKTTWQTIRYHVLHGLLMRYSLLSIVAFAWRNRHSFLEEEE